MKLRLLYCRWRGQAFNFDPFTYHYHQDNAKRIAGIRSGNILFRVVIQPPANREYYDTEIFEQVENKDHTKSTIPKINYFIINQKKKKKKKDKKKTCMWSKIVLATKIKMFIF